MKKTYYLFNPGRLSRKDNTLKFVPVDADGKEGTPRYLPIEGVDDLYCFGSLDTNSSVMNFLGKHKISVHYFDYYEHYTGSFYPKEYLLAGKLRVAQAIAYQNPTTRLLIARRFIIGAAANMQKNLAYYQRRDKELRPVINEMEQWTLKITEADDIESLMGVEGNIRQIYYRAFDTIINDFEMGERTRRPPENEVNALISFGNMLCYTACLDQIYHTQLDPTISFLHEPGYRRFSLALDLAEVFKPILVDRLIFRLFNKHQIKDDDFDWKVKGIVLKPKGKKTFVKAWEERLGETIKHRTIGRKVSYKHLIRIECYKLTKHLLDIETYQPFKIWW